MGTKTLEINILEKILAPHVDFLRNTTLRVQILENGLSRQEIQDWTKEKWKGMKELLFNESTLNCFTVLFHSAFDRDTMHKFKGWFCKGYNLSTLLFSPKFFPKLDDVILFLH